VKVGLSKVKKGDQASSSCYKKNDQHILLAVQNNDKVFRTSSVFCDPAVWKDFWGRETTSSWAVVGTPFSRGTGGKRVRGRGGAVRFFGNVTGRNRGEGGGKKNLKERGRPRKSSMRPRRRRNNGPSPDRGLRGKSMLVKPNKGTDKRHQPHQRGRGWKVFLLKTFAHGRHVR